MRGIFKIKFLMLSSAFLLLTLPSCYICVGGIYLRLAVFFILLVFGIYFVINNKTFLICIKNCIKTKASFWIILFSIWIFLSGLIAHLLGLCSITKVLSSIFLRFIPLSIFPYFLGYYISKKYSLNEILKFLYTVFLFVFFIGFLDFIFTKIDFPILSYTIVNHRTMIAGEIVKGMWDGTLRIQSVFDEASYFAYFIVSFLPLMYEIYNIKFKIFKNKILNFITKKFMPLIAWIMLLLTMSPMFLVIGIFQFLIYNIIKHTKSIIYTFTHIVFLFVGIFIFLYIFINFDFSGTFLERIQNTIAGLANMTELVQNSASLANRVINYYGLFLIFIDHPFFGVGFGCTLPHLYQKFTEMPFPLTTEIKSWLATSNPTDMNYTIFWGILAECGIWGLILLMIILFYIIRLTNKQIKKMPEKHKPIIKGMLYLIIFYITLSIYSTGLTLSFVWFICGILVGYVPNSNKIFLNKKDLAYATKNA